MQRNIGCQIFFLVVRCRQNNSHHHVHQPADEIRRCMNTLTTDFLEPGKKYMLHLYEDDDKLNTRTKVRSTHKKIKAGDKLVLKLKANGGAALHFTPLKK